MSSYEHEGYLEKLGEMRLLAEDILEIKNDREAVKEITTNLDADALDILRAELEPQGYRITHKGSIAPIHM